MEMTPAKTNTALQHGRLKKSLAAVQSKRSKSRTDSTKDAYAWDWKSYADFCESMGASEMPPREDILLAYFGDQVVQGMSRSTIDRRKSGLMAGFNKAGYKEIRDIFELEPFEEFFSGVARTGATNDKESITLDKLLPLIEVIDTDTLKGVRDKAIILVHWAGAFRVSELCSVKIDDLTYTGEGVRVKIPKSKTDQEGKGKFKPIYYGSNSETCPVIALKEWISQAGITSGPVFRGWSVRGIKNFDTKYLLPSPLNRSNVFRMLKSNLLKSGLDPAFYGTHSLRSGFITEAIRKNKNNHQIRAVSGQKSDSTINRYRKEEDAFKAGTGNIGL